MMPVTDIRKLKLAGLLIVYVAGLLLTAWLRYSQQHAADPPALAGYASIIYVLLIITTVVGMIRIGVPLQRVGFGIAIKPLRALGIAVAGILLLQVAGWLLAPVWETLFGAGRDLERFSDVQGSRAALVQLLVLSWSFAAFGEEIAFRILLMRGFAYLFGDTRKAQIIALLLQAFFFGLIHAYQGPTGIASSTISGLVFGALVLAGRGSLWPAALAHGGNNTIGIVKLYLGA